MGHGEQWTVKAYSVTRQEGQFVHARCSRACHAGANLGEGALPKQQAPSPLVLRKDDVLRGQQVAFFGRGVPVRPGARAGAQRRRLAPPQAAPPEQDARGCRGCRTWYANREPNLERSAGTVC